MVLYKEGKMYDRDLFYGLICPSPLLCFISRLGRYLPGRPVGSTDRKTRTDTEAYPSLRQWVESPRPMVHFSSRKVGVSSPKDAK
jgi:hypothetical protein